MAYEPINQGRRSFLSGIVGALALGNCLGFPDYSFAAAPKKLPPTYLRTDDEIFNDSPANDPDAKDFYSVYGEANIGRLKKEGKLEEVTKFFDTLPTPSLKRRVVYLAYKDPQRLINYLSKEERKRFEEFSRNYAGITSLTDGSTDKRVIEAVRDNYESYCPIPLDLDKPTPQQKLIIFFSVLDRENFFRELERKRKKEK